MMILAYIFVSVHVHLVTAINSKHHKVAAHGEEKHFVMLEIISAAPLMTRADLIHI